MPREHSGDPEGVQESSREEGMFGLHLEGKPVVLQVEKVWC